MSKSVTKGVHWLPRKSQYSLHGQRTGRVDVLPPGAAESLYAIADQIADGKAQLAKLREQREQLYQELHSRERFNLLHAKHVGHDSREALAEVTRLRWQIETIYAEMARVRRHVGSLSGFFHSTNQHMTFEKAFMRIAQAELAPDVWEALSFKASQLVKRAQR